MKRYGNLNFESLDTTGAYYSGVKLWSVFVPQSVRECQEYYPQVLELPKEHLKRLREHGELAPDESPGEEAEERRRSYLEQPVRPVLELVGDHRLPRLVILGDPARANRRSCGTSPWTGPGSPTRTNSPPSRSPC